MPNRTEHGRRGSSNPLPCDHSIGTGSRPAVAERVCQRRPSQPRRSNCCPLADQAARRDVSISWVFSSIFAGCRSVDSRSRESLSTERALRVKVEPRKVRTDGENDRRSAGAGGGGVGIGRHLIFFDFMLRLGLYEV